MQRERGDRVCGRKRRGQRRKDMREEGREQTGEKRFRQGGEIRGFAGAA